MLLEYLNRSSNVQKRCLLRQLAAFCDTASIFTKVIAGRAQTVLITRHRGAFENNGQTVPQRRAGLDRRM